MMKMIERPTTLRPTDSPAPGVQPRRKSATRVEIPAKRTTAAIVDPSPFGYTRLMRTNVTAAPLWESDIIGFLDSLRAADLSLQTIKMRSWQIRTLSQALRGIDPWDVREDELIGFMASQARNSEESALRGMRSAIRSFYNYGVTTRKIASIDNPAIGIRKISATPGIPHPADDEIVGAAYRWADDRVKMMISLGYYAGLRRSEICKVHTNDLRKINSGGMGSNLGLFVKGKGKVERIVPLTFRLADDLRNAPEGYLFPSNHRGWKGGANAGFENHLQPPRVGELVHEAFLAVTPPGQTVHTTHSLRHSFATNSYVDTDKNILAVQKLLGHSSVETTQIYTRIPDSELWQGVNGPDRLRRAG